jgi:hypothetical protein
MTAPPFVKAVCLALWGLAALAAGAGPAGEELCEAVAAVMLDTGGGVIFWRPCALQQRCSVRSRQRRRVATQRLRGPRPGDARGGRGAGRAGGALSRVR